MVPGRKDAIRGAGALRALLAALLLLGPEPVRGQAPVELPRVTGSVELSLVNVDVVVTGKDGKPVEGLGPADFTVLHGRRPVTITNFREEKPVPALPPAATPPPVAPAAEPAPVAAMPDLPEPPRVRRHVVVFVDHLALPDQREREQVFGSLRALLRATVQPGDGVMIVAWRYGVRTVWPFTDDVALLEERLDTVAQGTNRLGRESQNEIDRFAADDAAFAWAGLPPDSRLSRNLSVEEAYNEFKGKASAIMGLISTMSGMEGRKALVIASRSFSRRPGSEFGGARLDMTPLLDEISARANAAGVTIHTLFAAAWESEMPNVSDSRFSNPRIAGSSGVTRADDRKLNELSSLGTLSGRTGGVSLGTTMESSLFAERVASDLVHWYSIGYPLPEGTSGTADVSVRANRPGLTIRTRSGVVDRAPAERMEDRVLANLFRMDENARLPIAVSSGEPKKQKKKRWVTTALVRVPARHLVLLPGPDGLRGTVSVFWVSAGPAGDFSEVRRERHEVALADGPGPAETTVFSWEASIESSDPAARISIGVWDEVSGDAGFRVIRPAVR
jgi:VWFA-related protein